MGAGSGQIVRLKHALDEGDAVLEGQLALFQAPDEKFVIGRAGADLLDGQVEVPVLGLEGRQARAQIGDVFEEFTHGDRPPAVTGDDRSPSSVGLMVGGCAGPDNRKGDLEIAGNEAR